MMNTLSLAVFMAGATMAVATGGCSDAAPTEPAAGADFKLKVGQSATLAAEAGGSFTVTFAEVVGDSRCPTGVQCVWAGEVKIAVDFAQGGQGPTRAELTLGQDPAKARAALDGHTLVLLAVAPHPKAGVKIPPTQYEATLRVEKN